MDAGTDPASLLARLEAIGRALDGTPGALALLGLGSVGSELERLDRFSDLDFFVIVEQGRKQAFVDDLSWLAAAAPLAYAFRNTADGYKALFHDGIFCEFAVFEPAELAGVPFSPGRVVWSRLPFEAATSFAPAAGPKQPATVEWLVGEAITNLYVGLGRYRRGERLSAARFVQGYAVDRIIDLAGSNHGADDGPDGADVFDPARRFEMRHPAIAAYLPAFVPGYDRTPEAAAAILDYLEARYPVNGAMAAAIRALLSPEETA
jgi:hypothetical protein